MLATYFKLYKRRAVAEGAGEQSALIEQRQLGAERYLGHLLGVEG